MQVPVYGNMISVKKLIRILEDFGLDSEYILVDKYGNLAFCEIEKYDNGNLKNVKSEWIINLYSEHVQSYVSFLEQLKEDREARWGCHGKP